MWAVDSGIVAMAIGMIAATAVQETFGKENAGTAKMEPSPKRQIEDSKAASGIALNRFAQPAAYAIPATAAAGKHAKKQGELSKKSF